jgi:hypothetical protein
MYQYICIHENRCNLQLVWVPSTGRWEYGTPPHRTLRLKKGKRKKRKSKRSSEKGKIKEKF